MGEIYKITNLINGKCYVGQTKHKSVVRWRDHINGYHPSSLIHKAIVKYGVEAFLFEVIENDVPENKLDILEKRYISNFNAKAPNGYNLTDGGDGGFGLIVTEETRQKLSERRKGKPWSDKRKLYGTPHLMGNHFAIRKPVAMVDNNGDIIAVFDSVSEASHKTGIDRTGIGRVCRGKKQTTCGGYRWKFT